MFKKVLLPILFISASLAAPVYADSTTATDQPAASSQAASTDNGKLCSHAQRWQEMVQTLQLTQDQQDKIKAIKDNAKSAMKANWTQMKSIREEMKALVMSPTLDQGKLDALVQQKTTLIGNMMKTKITMKNQIYNLLNDQQKQQYQTLMTQWETKKREFFKQMGC
ncbi:16 kD immunogenic protein [Legionella quinlivanii]|uniref:16 kD immunogenic protein n=1 Tax=Legionella quinlivanii TaxID=45073 RepID=A0A0W0Y4P2_9GAMM|nr:Spy/CpxP family protein refolding chaperone [Legionella quinlivanii]KTD51754.1 16 kD immunogenic protein [Legionella quinlivanii]MCW8451091.1 Spy/CpxP family protein refolding chaperone [Legionella quinlivanii]SEF65288.1 LTXXQ motif family protein [Legionella quinlivanii DSM 21216]STY10718.1 16 kD immunogenic protein [Legionella quinlivanii]